MRRLCANLLMTLLPLCLTSACLGEAGDPGTATVPPPARTNATLELCRTASTESAATLALDDRPLANISACPPASECDTACESVRERCIASGIETAACELSANRCHRACEPESPPPCVDECFAHGDACFAAGLDAQECELIVAVCLDACAPAQTCQDDCFADFEACFDQTGDSSRCGPTAQACLSDCRAPRSCEDVCFGSYERCVEETRYRARCEPLLDECIMDCEPEPSCEYSCFATFDECVASGVAPSACEGLLDECALDCAPVCFVCPDGRCLSDPRECGSASCDPVFEVAGCDGACQRAERLGNGLCDISLACAMTGFDGGDCVGQY